MWYNNNYFKKKLLTVRSAFTVFYPQSYQALLIDSLANPGAVHQISPRPNSFIFSLLPLIPCADFAGRV